MNYTLTPTKTAMSAIKNHRLVYTFKDEVTIFVLNTHSHYSEKNSFIWSFDSHIIVLYNSVKKHHLLGRESVSICATLNINEPKKAQVKNHKSFKKKLFLREYRY